MAGDSLPPGARSSGPGLAVGLSSRLLPDLPRRPRLELRLSRLEIVLEVVAAVGLLSLILYSALLRLRLTETLRNRQRCQIGVS